jgi:hypothetical protein
MPCPAPELSTAGRSDGDRSPTGASRGQCARSRASPHGRVDEDADTQDDRALLSRRLGHAKRCDGRSVCGMGDWLWAGSRRRDVRDPCGPAIRARGELPLRPSSARPWWSRTGFGRAVRRPCAEGQPADRHDAGPSTGRDQHPCTPTPGMVAAGHHRVQVCHLQVSCLGKGADYRHESRRKRGCRAWASLPMRATMASTARHEW